ncbi:hypothetical protein FACS1894124_8010 [Spirochaetia bacterium]|nr:hypothetical protein FACS1894124_8010 [Spirochaetia bacterium]
MVKIRRLNTVKAKPDNGEPGRTLRRYWDRRRGSAGQTEQQTSRPKNGGEMKESLHIHNYRYTGPGSLYDTLNLISPPSSKTPIGSYDRI